MKLHDLRPEDVRRALDLYRAEAFADAPPEEPDLSGGSLREILERFEDESQYQGADRAHRYVLRLGNDRYRSMKLALTEYLVLGEYVFVVDTHDQVDIPPEYPGHREWVELREHNLEVKSRVETRWREEGLPTMRDLPRLAAARANRPRLEGAPRILVVDDDPDIRETAAAVLDGEGYRVLTAADGEQGLALATEIQPDLVVLDYMMPGLTGCEVCRSLLADPATVRIPRLLSTATPLSAGKLQVADAVLYKPYSARLFLSYVAELLHSSTAVGLRRHHAG